MTERRRLLAAGLLVASLAIGFWAASSSDRQANGKIEAAEAAVRAWGEFASTGDLRLVAGAFAVEGPQYAQFLADVAEMVPDGDYRYVLTDAVLISPGVVRGWVEATSPAGEIQTYRWDIELVATTNHWRVWTIRTTSEGLVSTGFSRSLRR